MSLFVYCHHYHFSIQISILKLVVGTYGARETQENSKNYVVQLPSYRWKLNYRQAMKFNFVPPQHQGWCCNYPGISKEKNCIPLHKCHFKYYYLKTQNFSLR